MLSSYSYKFDDVKPAHGTLSMSMQCCKHENHRVVPWTSFDERIKSAVIKLYYRLSFGPFRHLPKLLLPSILLLCKY